MCQVLDAVMLGKKRRNTGCMSRLFASIHSARTWCRSPVRIAQFGFDYAIHLRNPFWSGFRGELRALRAHAVQEITHLPMTCPLRYRAGETPAATMAKSFFSERQRANCGGGRPARHSVVQTVIVCFVGPKSLGWLRLTVARSVAVMGVIGLRHIEGSHDEHANHEHY